MSNDEFAKQFKEAEQRYKDALGLDDKPPTFPHWWEYILFALLVLLLWWLV